MDSSSNTTAEIRVSMVMPCLNEAAGVAAALRSGRWGAAALRAARATYVAHVRPKTRRRAAR